MKTQSQLLSLVFSLTALILYVPANIFPFMSIELYGKRNTSTIWGGIVSLADAGSWAIAIIVFLASILIPFLKLLTLFYLSLSDPAGNPQLKNTLYVIVENIGRWSMLDIFLLAIMISILKLGKWATVEPKVGALLFAMVVIFTMLASAYFKSPLKHREGSDEG